MNADAGDNDSAGNDIDFPNAYVDDAAGNSGDGSGTNDNQGNNSANSNAGNNNAGHNKSSLAQSDSASSVSTENDASNAASSASIAKPIIVETASNPEGTGGNSNNNGGSGSNGGSGNNGGGSGSQDSHTISDYGIVTPNDFSAGNYDEKVKKPYVLLIYMCGTNLETDDGSATLNIKQMIGSGYDPDNMEVIIFAGGTKTWKNEIENVCKQTGYDNDSGNNVVYRVHPGNGINSDTLEPIFGVSLANADIGTPECMAGAINWIYDNYDAEHYSMIMWDHGGGINGTSCINAITDKSFTAKELCQGFRSSKLFQAGEKFDFLGMDECLMGSLDLAMVLSSYADYYIGSEEIESGEGWNYCFIKDLSELPSSRINVYKKIVDDYVEYRIKNTDEQLMAVMDLSKADAVHKSYENLMDALCKYCDSDRSGAWYSNIQKIRGESY